MGWSKNVGCHYKYKISLDIYALMEYIAKQIGANGEIDDDSPELDGENVEFTFNDFIYANVYYAPATRWEPEEWDMEVPDWVTFEKEELNRLITKALREIPDGIINANYDCDTNEFELDEPEPPDYED